MWLRRLCFAAVLMSALGLAACSSGGGDGAPPAPTDKTNWDELKWDQDKWSGAEEIDIQMIYGQTHVKTGEIT